MRGETIGTVSYTHLDVYKRQNQALARDTIAALQNAAMEVRQVLAGAWDWQ